MDAAPAPPPRPGFWKRHRTTILTAGLVLYALALGVGVVDDVFHLGLFPTDLERRAAALIERFDDADPATRGEAVEKFVREIDTFVAVPALFRALDSPSQQRRAVAIEVLRRITKARHGYAPDASVAQRRAAIRRWRAWWRENKYRY